MMQIHEQIVFMDKSAVIYVLILTRTGVTVNVKHKLVNVVIFVAVPDQFTRTLF